MNPREQSVCTVCGTPNDGVSKKSDIDTDSDRMAKPEQRIGNATTRPSFFSELFKVAPSWMLYGRTVGPKLFNNAAAVYAPVVATDTVVELGPDTPWTSGARTVTEVVEAKAL